jgi:MFS family permease
MAFAALLGQRDFALFWAGQGISMTGNGLYEVGLAWSVYQLTGSTAAMGTVLAANAVPWLALALFGGTLADRFPRRSVVLIADSAAAIVTWFLSAAAARHDLSMTMLITAAALLGTVTAFYRPAYSAMNRDLIPEDSFREANALLSITGNITRVLGPALGGVAYTLGGPGLVFGLDAASFSIAAVAMLATRTRDRPAGLPGRGLLSDLAAGLKYTAGTRWLALMLAISLIANFACLAPYAVLLPALVRSHHHGVNLLGLLTAVEVVGSVLGALLIGRLRGVRAGPALLVLASLIGAGTMTLGLMAGHAAALFLGAALIGAGLTFGVIENTVLQVKVPEELLSRVYGVNIVVSFALLPVGDAAAGLLARWAGISWVLAGGGALLIISCACAALLRPVRNLNVRW